MKINPMTMLAYDINDKEREDIINICRDIIMHGKIDWEHPIVKQWVDVCSPNERSRSFLFTTVISQRLLLSLHVE